jgi:DNA replicative helicase MCM subunit Mcm2 (Cdc46/Mcm family)
VNQKLVFRVTNMEKKVKKQEERKDEMRVKMKELEKKNADLKLKFENIKTLDSQKTKIQENNFISPSDNPPGNNSVVVLMSKKNHSNENTTEILAQKIKEHYMWLKK